jgi:hypothetical protein
MVAVGSTFHWQLRVLLVDLSSYKTQNSLRVLQAIQSTSTATVITALAGLITEHQGQDSSTALYEGVYKCLYSSVWSCLLPLLAARKTCKCLSIHTRSGSNFDCVVPEQCCKPVLERYHIIKWL